MIRRCWGPEPHQHAPGCRAGRPLCRWRRKIRATRRPCYCGAYHYAHRFGGGRCQNADRMELHVHGPVREVPSPSPPLPTPEPETFADWFAQEVA